MRRELLLIFSIFAPLFGCKEDPTIHANRLKVEASRIQNSTLKAILKNDLKFQIDLDEQQAFFAALRADMERCRGIEAELRTISQGPEIARLEENSTGILLSISKREEQNQRYRDAKPKVGATPDHAAMIEVLERTIGSFTESGRDTTEAEQLLSQLKKQEAEQGRAGQPATRSHSKSEGGDKPQPESEGRSR